MISNIILTEKDFKNVQNKGNMFFKDITNHDINNCDNLRKFASKALNFSLKEKSMCSSPVFADIWTADLDGSVGSEIDKVRPCIIWDTGLNSNTTCVIPITSNEDNPLIHINLTKDCFLYLTNTISGNAKCEGIRSISNGRFGNKIGRLSNKGISQVSTSLLYILNFHSLIENFEEITIRDYIKETVI